VVHRHSTPGKAQPAVLLGGKPRPPYSPGGGLHCYLVAFFIVGEYQIATLNIHGSACVALEPVVRIKTCGAREQKVVLLVINVYLYTSLHYICYAIPFFLSVFCLFFGFFPRVPRTGWGARDRNNPVGEYRRL